MRPTPSTPEQDSRASPTFADAWALWLGFRAHSARPLRASTLADYESIYRRHLEPTLAQVPLAAIDGATIARLTIALSCAGVRPKRLSNVLVPLRACLRWHYRLGAIERDPGPWFEASAAGSDERRILTPQQIDALVCALPVFYRPLVEFAAYTGVRAGELRALTWDDVDLAARTARIDKTYYRQQLQRSTKTGRDRTVPLPPHIADMLAEWLPRCPPTTEGLVFPTQTGRPLDLDTFRARVFRPGVARAGLPAATRFHDLRHTAASLYLSTGATVREVMEICGWSQLATAQRYLHHTDELGQAAARLSAMRQSQLSAPHYPEPAHHS